MKTIKLQGTKKHKRKLIDLFYELDMSFDAHQPDCIHLMKPNSEVYAHIEFEIIKKDEFTQIDLNEYANNITSNELFNLQEIYKELKEENEELKCVVKEYELSKIIYTNIDKQKNRVIDQFEAEVNMLQQKDKLINKIEQFTSDELKYIKFLAHKARLKTLIISKSFKIFDSIFNKAKRNLTIK